MVIYYPLLIHFGMSPQLLKAYYEIVGESGYVPTHADFFTEMHF